MSERATAEMIGNHARAALAALISVRLDGDFHPDAVFRVYPLDDPEPGDVRLIVTVAGYRDHAVLYPGTDLAADAILLPGLHLNSTGYAAWNTACDVVSSLIPGDPDRDWEPLWQFEVRFLTEAQATAAEATGLTDGVHPGRWAP